MTKFGDLIKKSCLRVFFIKISISINKEGYKVSLSGGFMFQFLKHQYFRNSAEELHPYVTP
jgi:hypothetical protein